MGLYVKYSVSEANVAKNILPLLFVTIGFGLVGFVDDFKKLVLKNTEGLKPSYKMLGLLIISVLYVDLILLFFPAALSYAFPPVV